MALNEHEVAALVLGEALARKDHHFEAIGMAARHTLDPELTLLAWATALELNKCLYETDEFASMSRVYASIFRKAGADSPIRDMRAKVAEWLKPPKPPVKVGDEVFYGGNRAVDKVVVIAISGLLAWVQSHTGLNVVVPLDELYHS